MKVQSFEGCPVSSDTFTTGFGLTLFDPDTGKKLHDIEISANAHHTDVGCGGRVHDNVGGKSFSCLGGGALELIVDGEKITHSVQHELGRGGQGRVYAFNTISACSRRWFDFDVTPAEEVGHQIGAGSPLRSSRRRLLQALEARTVLDVLSNTKKTMVNEKECYEWLEKRRQDNNSMFTASGRWSTFIIETKNVNFHIEYKQEAERCEAHNLDVWISRVDPSIANEHWEGVIGETKKSNGASAHSQRHIPRSEALKFAADEDYEVISPFSKKCKACVNRE